MGFDEIIAGIKVDEDPILRENAILQTGRMFFRTAQDRTLADPVLTFLITSTVWCSHILEMTMEELLPQEAFERIYMALLEEFDELREEHEEIE